MVEYNYDIKDFNDKIDYQPEGLRIRLSPECHGCAHIHYYKKRHKVMVVRLSYGHLPHIKAEFAYEKEALKLKEIIDKIKGMSQASIDIVSSIPFGYAL